MPSPTLNAELFRAAGLGDTEKVVSLVARGAQLDPSISAHESPLQASALHGQDATSLKLIELGARTNVMGKKGTPLLMYAALGGSVELVKRLVELGADVGACNKHGAGVFDYAVQSDNLVGGAAVAKFLIGLGCYDHNSLYLAAYHRREAIIDHLLEEGEDIDGSNGRPLCFAIQHHDVDFVRFLLSRGADPALAKIQKPAPYRSRVERLRDYAPTTFESGTYYEDDPSDEQLQLAASNALAKYDAIMELLDEYKQT